MKDFLKKLGFLFKKPVIEPPPILEQPNSRPITDRLDAAAFYFGYDYRVNDKLIIRQKTLGDIIEFGEARYYSSLHMLTTNPYDYMSELDDSGIDFTVITDIEFFSMFVKGITTECSNFFFGNTIDISKLSLFLKNGETILYDVENDIQLDNLTLKRIVDCLCMMNGLKKERFKPAGRIAKEYMIQLDREEKRDRARNKHDKKSSSLLPILSSAINYPGYKYNREETLKLNIFFFMDCISRIKLKDSVDGLTIGWYTGSLDTKKFKPEKQLNWMRDLSE